MAKRGDDFIAFLSPFCSFACLVRANCDLSLFALNLFSMCLPAGGHQRAFRGIRMEAEIAPSTAKSAPDTYELSSLPRKSAACAISRGLPARSIGMRL